MDQIKKHEELIKSQISSLYVDNKIEKGSKGEGSKGGKVIGHTKSGKPVYETSSFKDHADKHKGFTIQDHEDARDVHDNERKKVKNKDQRAYEKHGGHIDKHYLSIQEKHLANAFKGFKGKHEGKVSPQFLDSHVHFDVKDKDSLEKHLTSKNYVKKQEGSSTYYRNDKLDHEFTVHAKREFNPLKKSEIDELFSNLIIDGFEKGEDDTLEKAKGVDYPIGTIRDFAGRPHIKTPEGWKYHGKGSGQKAQNHSNAVTNAGHGLGENASHDAHAEEVSQRQKLDEERRQLISEKTSDINFKFKMFAAAVKGVITGKFKSVIGYGTGGVGKTYTVIGQLAAAGKTAFDEDIHKPANTVDNTANDGDEDEEVRNDSKENNTDYDYVKITGFMTAPELYKAMFEHNGKLLVFDDCDKVLTDGSCVNLFKGALDTSGDGTISYSTKTGVKDEEGSKLPKRFKFNGRCIFVSNLKPEVMPQPLKSRGVRVDLSMDRKQTIERIKQIAQHPKTGKYSNLKFPGIDDYSHEDMEAVIGYIDKHRDHLHMDDLNVRTIGKILGLKQIAEELGEHKDWEKYADQTVFSKGENFDYNGGIMKSSQNFIDQLYKGGVGSGKHVTAVFMRNHSHATKEERQQVAEKYFGDKNKDLTKVGAHHHDQLSDALYDVSKKRLSKSDAVKSEMNVDRDEMIDEHEKLIKVLQSSSHTDDIEEAKKQQEELKEIKDEVEKGGVGSGRHTYVGKNTSGNHLVHNSSTGRIHELTAGEVKEITKQHHNDLPKHKDKGEYLPNHDYSKTSDHYLIGKDQTGDHVVKIVQKKENGSTYHTHYSDNEMKEVYGKDMKKSEEDELQKGGESKAEKKAKKIGKTKSGKDIYDDHDDENHKDFSSADHRDAADLLHTLKNDPKNGFPGNVSAQRNKHLDSVIEKTKKEEKAKLKAQPSAGDKITTKDGISGDVKHRDETHTYIEHKSEDKVNVSKVKNEELDAKIAAGHYTHHKPTNVKKDEIKKSENIDEAFDELIKGGPGSGRHKESTNKKKENDDRVYSLVGKSVFVPILDEKDNNSDGQQVKVTDAIIDSIGEYLGDENIECTKENFLIAMANLELDEKQAKNLLNGDSFEPSFNDSEEDMLSDMRGEDDEED